MRREQVKVVNHLGLHARAAAQLVKLASSFESKITLKRVDGLVEADAKSILSVLSLAAGRGTELELIIDGSDEDAAAEGIIGLFEGGFGES